MITCLQAKNFKSWKDTDRLEFAPLTGLFGTNSSGKTSILQMLLMLKQTAESPDRKRVLHTGDDRSLVDLGTFFDLIHGTAKDSPLDLSLSWELLKQLDISDPEKLSATLYNIASLTFDVTVKSEGERAVVDQFAYSFNSEKFGMSRIPDGKKKGKYDLVCPNFRATRFSGRPWPLPAPVKCYGFPDEVSAYYQNVGFLSQLVLEFEGLFARVAYLGPLREYPKRSYVWAGEQPADVGRKGELAVAALLASRAQGMKFSPGPHKHKVTMENRIEYWLRQMGMISSYALERVKQDRKDYELRVRTTSSSPEVFVTDVGFGVSQVLPVLVLCYYVPAGSIVVLEQPEIHLHPSVQAWLADVFIEVVTKRNVQIILESHSEHLLRRLQRRIAEGWLSSDKAALYFCRMNGDASAVEKLNIDLLGNITNWPQDFFGNAMEDAVAMVEAAVERKPGSPA